MFLHSRKENKYMDVEAKITEHDQKISKLENFEVRVSEQYNTIQGRLDSIEQKLDRNEEKYVNRDMCKTLCAQHKQDIDNIGRIARGNAEDLQMHLLRHNDKTEKYLYWISTALIGIFIVGKIAKAW